MKILILDIETDGLDPRIDSIVEIGCALLDSQNGEMTTAFDKLILEKDHQLDDCAWIFGHSTLTPQMVREKGVDLENIRLELQNLLNMYPTISYNGPQFDFKFLKMKGFEIKKPAPDPMYIMTDVCKIRGRRDGYKWPSVQECLNYFGIVASEPHRALGDAILEAKIVWEMIQQNHYDLNSSIWQALSGTNTNEIHLARYTAKIDLYSPILKQLNENREDCLKALNTNSNELAIVRIKAKIESYEHLIQLITEKNDFCVKKITELQSKSPAAAAQN